MTEPPPVTFLLEQTLGHVTHTSNLRRLVGRDDRIDARFVDLHYAVEGWARAVPGYSNWTIRSGWRARRALRASRHRPARALFFHTQVPAILNLDHLRRIPTVVSLDATPLQYDALGEQYGHSSQWAWVERQKWRANRASFRRATALVTWAEWTKGSLVSDYGVPADDIHVIAPGVDTALWAGRARPPRADRAPLRVLFVGADLVRKGGDLLIDAVRRLVAAGVPVEADIVTAADVPSSGPIHVHRGLTPNSDALIELYRSADVFCLPTLGDCLPMVLSEAGAMGLPLVSTDVGAITEIVRDGQTGLVVPPGDVGPLEVALRRLAEDTELRAKLGDGARTATAADFDAAVNARRLVDLLIDATSVVR